MNIPFSPPDITEAEIAEVCETLRSGWITTGPRTKQFEKDLSAYIGSNRTVCLNSATSALELTLRMFDVGPGDEVLVPAYTYTASCSVICHVGATPVLVDTARDSYEMDYEALADAVTEKTKAMIPVDLAGIPCDYQKLSAIAENKKDLFRPSGKFQEALGRMLILSDCAHGLGAERDGLKTGLLADFTCYSFHAVKNLTTAEGGAVTWKPLSGISDDELYRTYQVLSLHGQTKDAFQKTRAGSWEYDVIAPYYKCNMTDITAAIGLIQLRRYPGMLERRFEIIHYYDSILGECGIKLPAHEGKHFRGSGHLYLTRVEGCSHEQRCEIITELEKKGIAANVHYKPLPLLTAYKNMGFDSKNYPNAIAQYENEITLPLYSKLTDEQAEYVAKTMKEILEKRK